MPHVVSLTPKLTTKCTLLLFPVHAYIHEWSLSQGYGGFANIRTSVLDKKKAALVALGSLAEHAPLAFYQHLPQAMETLNEQVRHARVEGFERWGICLLAIGFILCGLAGLVDKP